MRRIARGRLVPQSRSTDPRMGRVSLKAATLYDRMWINGDDQGRLSGDPDEIKYTTCPNLPDISTDNIPDLLNELVAEGLIEVFSTSRHSAIQMLDWWEEQKLQWAYPSPYSAPPGWTDHLRYHPTPKEIITVNWPPSELPSKPPSELPSELPSEPAESPLTTPLEEEKEKEKEEGKGRLPSTLPSALGSNSPSPVVLPVTLFNKMKECYRIGWGTVRAEAPDEVIPRPPDARIDAQMRDLAHELSSAGGCPLEYIEQAFKEADGQSKYHISYVRAILLDWLGIERNREK